MGMNKFVYFGETKFDLTGDTIEKSKVLSGYTFHGKDGEADEGTCTFDVDTSGCTVAVAEILNGKTAGARGVILEGTMPNIGKQTGTISTKEGTVSISQGYHDGSGSVGISSTEKAKLIASNIRENVTILGITGSMSASEGENAEDSKSVTPSKEQQTVTPTSGYTCLRQVVVAAIPYAEAPNSAGGTTITIG